MKMDWMVLFYGLCSPKHSGVNRRQGRERRISANGLMLDRRQLGQTLPGRMGSGPNGSSETSGRPEVVPDVIGAIQTFGDLVHFHPHIHGLVSQGVFLPDGTLLPLPNPLSPQFSVAGSNKTALAENAKVADTPLVELADSVLEARKGNVAAWELPLGPKSNEKFVAWCVSAMKPGEAQAALRGQEVRVAQSE